MDLIIDYKEIKNQLDILYINNLIKVCDKNNIKTTDLYKKIDDLQKEEHNSETKKTLIKSKSAPNLSNNDSPVPQYNDDYLYQKPWTKLTAIHKIIKIKEFVNNLLIDNENDKQALKDILSEMVKNKILTKKEEVSYDPINCKVISISQLKYKDGKYLI